MTDPDKLSSDEGGLIGWFTRNHVAANILMFAIIAMGGMAVFSIQRDVFPAGDTFAITVSVAYPGASPLEVEEGICKRIENELFGLDGVKKVSASANENVGGVTVEVMREFDVTEVLDRVKARVDSIDNFPIAAKRPIVTEVEMRRQAVSIAVSGNTDEKSLKSLAIRLRDELMQLPDISHAELISARAYEISIEVSEDALRRYGLTLGGVANAIRNSSLDLPGGTVKTEGGEVMLRTVGQRYVGDDFAELVLFTRADGTVIRISDIGAVVDGFAEGDEASRFDGERAVLVQVFRVGDQDVVQVVDAVKGHVAALRAELPVGMNLTLWGDETVILAGRIDLLVNNLASGLLLVFLVLALFLRLKLAFWVVLGIPVSFLGCFAIMPMFDVSVNMISLFAFLLVLGVVVDDAIVVGESVHSMRKRSMDAITASIRGTKIVSVPVTFGVLTTVAAFTPMLDMPGGGQKLWQQIGIIVIACLLFSLIESKLVLPAHLASLKFDDPKGPISRGWAWFRSIFTGGLDRFVARIYKPLLGATLRNRYVAVCVAVSVLALSVTLVVSGFVKRAYFPPMEGDNIVANLVLPQGAPIDETERKLRVLEDAADELRNELIAESATSMDVFDHVLSSIGTQPFNVLKSQNGGKIGSTFLGSHLGEVNIQLLPAEIRDVGAGEVLRRWSEKVGEIAGVEELTYSADLFGTGKDINVQLAGADMEDLRRAADELKQHLRGKVGVSEVVDSFKGGKAEVELRIKTSAQLLGLSQQDLATQVRQAFYGEEVQRVQRRGEDMRVMVRFPEDRRNSLAALEDMRIRTPSGDEVPFYTVADASFGRGFATISRADRRRTISVTAKVDRTGKVSAGEVVAELQEKGGFLSKLVGSYQGVESYSLEGDNRDQQETMDAMAVGYALVLFMIYALLAIPFRSYLQPFLVMTAIPFGFIGAILGHAIMGLEISIMSFLGFVALTGVVVNDNLVLVDFINRRRREGAGLMEAVSSAGVARFRPILLTSLTTCASLTPFLLERSVQAMFLVPMAVSLAFGVLFATSISLLLVPSGYLILEDMRRVVGRCWDAVVAS